MIFYIAGYGRSGSTLLDIVLSNAAYGFTLGEISNVFNERNKKTDDFYHEILSETIIELKLTHQEIDKISSSDKIQSHLSSKYASFWNYFLKKIGDKHKMDFFIDSSKTTWRTFNRPKHLKNSGIKIKIIFLKASYKKVWKSAIKGSNKSLKSKSGEQKKHYIFAVKTLFSKFLIDTLTTLFYKNKTYEIIEVHYDDFISSPKEIINKISKDLNFKFSNLEPKIEQNKFLIKGGYLGNRLREKGTYISIKKSR